jgi:hypothetical protein
MFLTVAFPGLYKLLAFLSIEGVESENNNNVHIGSIFLD